MRLFIIYFCLNNNFLERLLYQKFIIKRFTKQKSFDLNNHATASSSLTPVYFNWVQVVSCELIYISSYVQDCTGVSFQENDVGLSIIVII